MTSPTGRVLVPLAEGFEEIEAVTIVDVLRRARLSVTTAALGGAADCHVPGAHGMVVRADTALDAVDREQRFDAVVLPGGGPGARRLQRDERVLDALRSVVARGGIAAALCAAPIALQSAGLLAGRRATAYPSFRAELVDAEVVGGRVVEDGPIVTGAGPGAALEFALALVARLVSPATADELAEGMLVTR